MKETAVAARSDDSAGTVTVRSGSVALRAGQLAERYALVGLWVAVCLLFSVLPQTRGTFPTVTNIRQILANQAAVTILAVGAIFPLVAGAFDLSVGAVAGVSAVGSASAMSRFHAPLAVAVLVGLALASLMGVANGLLIAKFRLNSLIVTLGVYTFLTGMITWYTGGNNITTGVSGTLASFGASNWLGVPSVLYVVFIVVFASWYVLGHTPFGRYVHAIGSNPRAAQLVGIKVQRETFLCFVVSGFLAGVTGVIMVATNGGAVISEGPDLLFPILTAVFLSATTITPGTYNVMGAVVGVLLIASSVSGLTLAGAADWVSDVFNGAALVLAVAVSTLVARSRGARSATRLAVRSGRDPASAVAGQGVR
jgi:ribose transport system permease protein